jgi:hypothetical protein
MQECPQCVRHGHAEGVEVSVLLSYVLYLSF